jgi:hypothetical protein
VFNALHTEYGNTQATVDASRRFLELFPNFDLNDVKSGILCGILHDYGEVKLKVDVPHNRKTPYAIHIERAAAAAYAQELHTPAGENDEFWDILERRYLSDHDPSIVKPTSQELRRVEMSLHPSEIGKALVGTESQTYGNVERGLAFEAVERLEYTLTALRGFEAVENNRQNIRQDSYLAQLVLWLSIDSTLNHFEDILENAEKYVAIYDYIKFNEADFDHYFNAIIDDIDMRENGDEALANTVFGSDPFESYQPSRSQTDRINREQAKRQFIDLVAHWQAWKQKPHIARDAWEAFIGTDHPMAADQQDISFLHYTARQRRRLSPEAGRIAIELPINDQFGVGLDPEIRRQHEESIYL